MATVTATGSGDWSAVIPAYVAGDTVKPAGYTVAIDARLEESDVQLEEYNGRIGHLENQLDFANVCLQESDQRNAALVTEAANGVQVSENLQARLDGAGEIVARLQSTLDASDKGRGGC